MFFRLPTIFFTLCYRLNQQPSNDTLKLGQNQSKLNGISDAAFKVPLPDSIDSQTNGKSLLDDVSTNHFFFKHFKHNLNVVREKCKINVTIVLYITPSKLMCAVYQLNYKMFLRICIL